MTENKVTFVLMDPATGLDKVVKQKAKIGAPVEFKGLKGSVVLDGKLMRDGGRTAYIDASRMVQVGFEGINGWRGIDGLRTWLAIRDIRARQVNMATNQDYLKWAKIVMGIFIATMLANIITIVVLAGKVT